MRNSKDVILPTENGNKKIERDGVTQMAKSKKTFHFYEGTTSSSIRFDITCEERFAKTAIEACKKAKKKVDEELGFQEKVSLQVKAKTNDEKLIIFWVTTLDAKEDTLEELYKIFYEIVQKPLEKL